MLVVLEVELVPVGVALVLVDDVPVAPVEVEPTVDDETPLVDDVMLVSVDAVVDDDVEPVASVPVVTFVLLSFEQPNMNTISAAANRTARDFFIRVPLLKKNALR